jgi:hypothetical protein
MGLSCTLPRLVDLGMHPVKFIDPFCRKRDDDAALAVESATQLQAGTGLGATHRYLQF